jgi:hypothetical protein
MPAIKLPPSPTKEERYWAYEFPIAILLVIGAAVLAVRVPTIISRSTNWATMFIGIGEAIVAVACFYMTRLNVVRIVSAAVFAAGAVAFVLGLAAVY